MDWRMFHDIIGILYNIYIPFSKLLFVIEGQFSFKLKSLSTVDLNLMSNKSSVSIGQKKNACFFQTLLPTKTVVKMLSCIVYLFLRSRNHIMEEKIMNFIWCIYVCIHLSTFAGSSPHSPCSISGPPGWAVR